MDPGPSRMLAEAMNEVRSAASEITRLLEAAPRADTAALDTLCIQLDAIAFRARALALEARIEGWRRREQGGRYAQLSAEIGILAERSLEAVVLLRRLRAARASGDEHALPGLLLSVARSSSGAPP